MTPFQTYKAQDRMKRIKTECQHAIQEDGATARLDLIESGSGTATGWKYFCKGIQGSPLGRIISVSDDSVTVEYYAAEILNLLETYFKS